MWASLDRLESRCLLTSASATVTFLKQDTSTQGNWTGTYGTEGYDVLGRRRQPPGLCLRHTHRPV